MLLVVVTAGCVEVANVDVILVAINEGCRVIYGNSRADINEIAVSCVQKRIDIEGIKL